MNPRAIHQQPPSFLDSLHRSVATVLRFENHEGLARTLHLVEQLYHFALFGRQPVRSVAGRGPESEDSIQVAEQLARVQGLVSVRGRVSADPEVGPVLRHKHFLHVVPRQRAQILDGFHDKVLVDLEVPADGDPNDALACRRLEQLLQLLLGLLRALQAGEAHAERGEVAHRRGVVHGLEAPVLEDRVAEAEHKGHDVGQEHKDDLPLHQPVLRLIAPGDHRTELPRRGGCLQAQDEEVRVHHGSQGDPAQEDDHPPNDDGYLEVEVQRQPRAGDLRVEEVGGERPETPALGLPRPVLTAIGHLLRHVQLRARAERQTLSQASHVRQWAGPEFHVPHGNDGQHRGPEHDDVEPHVPEATSARAIHILQDVAQAAGFAAVGAACGALAAARNGAPTAIPQAGVWDRGIHVQHPRTAFGS
mmetsp:Transcript_97139/g.313689  ORF Transcript_97139/g.313689 Transcript_97139/m.313689 type:complete len:418 (-) Transcript_97139:165-1418(-)